MDTILSASFLTALFASGVRQSIPPDLRLRG